MALYKREDIFSQIDADIYGSEVMDQGVPRYRMPLLLHFLRRPDWVKADPDPRKTVQIAELPSSQPTRSRT